MSAKLKTRSADGSASWTETLEFEVPAKSKLTYVAEWVSDDGGDYLSIPSLQLKHDQKTVFACDNGCKTSLAGRYVLLRKAPQQQLPILVDVGTCDIPIAHLVFASWVR